MKRQRRRRYYWGLLSSAVFLSALAASFQNCQGGFQSVDVASEGGPSVSTSLGTPAPTQSPRPTATPLGTATPQPSMTPTPTPNPSATPSPTASPTATPTPRPTMTPIPSPTIAPSPTPTPTPVAGRPCANSKAVLCEDFEAGIDLSIWKWEGPVKHTVSNQVAYRGSSSLHVNTDSYGWLVHSGRLPVSGKVLYGRLFVSFVKTPPGAWSHWSMAFASEQGKGPSGPILWVDGQTDQSGRPHFIAGSNGTSFGDWTFHDIEKNDYNVIPMNRWICVEWMMNQNTNEMKTWLDGVERTTLTINSQTKPGFVLPQANYFYLGYADYHNTKTPADLYIDEFVLDTKRVGCTP